MIFLKINNVGIDKQKNDEKLGDALTTLKIRKAVIERQNACRY